MHHANWFHGKTFLKTQWLNFHPSPDLRQVAVERKDAPYVLTICTCCAADKIGKIEGWGARVYYGKVLCLTWKER